MKQQENNIKEKIKEKEIVLLREISRAEILSTEAITKLQIQDEILGTVNNEVEVLNCKLSFTEKIVSNMKHMLYFLSAAPEKEADNKENKKPQKYTDTSIRKYDNKDLDTLDIALQRLNVIKNNAKMQNVLLCEQNKKLDNIASNADDAMNKIEKLNKDIKKI